MSETRDAIGGCLGAVIVAVVVVVLAGVVTFVGWHANWWFTSQNIARTNHAIQAGYANQTGLLSDFDNTYSQVVGMGPQITQAPAAARQGLIDQRLALAGKACADAAQITIPLGAGNRAWVNANCSGSSVSAGSSLRKGS